MGRVVVGRGMVGLNWGEWAICCGDGCRFICSCGTIIRYWMSLGRATMIRFGDNRSRITTIGGGVGCSGDRLGTCHTASHCMKIPRLESLPPGWMMEEQQFGTAHNC